MWGLAVTATLSQHKERDYGLPYYRYRDRVPRVCKRKDLGLHAYRYRDRVLIVNTHILVYMLTGAEIVSHMFVNTKIFVYMLTGTEIVFHIFVNTNILVCMLRAHIS